MYPMVSGPMSFPGESYSLVLSLVLLGRGGIPLQDIKGVHPQAG